MACKMSGCFTPAILESLCNCCSDPNFGFLIALCLKIMKSLLLYEPSARHSLLREKFFYGLNISKKQNLYYVNYKLCLQ